MLRRIGVELERVEGLVGAAPDLARREAERARPEAHVLAQRPCEELLVGVLEHRADAPGQLLRRTAGSVPVTDPHGAFVGMGETRDEADDGRFAGAVAAQQRDALPGGDLERDIAQRRDVPVRERDPVEGECPRQRHRCTASTTVSG